MTLDHEAQRTLVTGLKAGRPEAFERMYDALHARVFNFVARMVGDREEAADITQEVFLEAYRRIPDAPGDLRLEPWIYRVAANTAIDHLRRRKVRSGESLPEEERIPARHDAFDAYQQSETAALVGAALMGMNDRYRAALVLKDLHGLDNREVASALGVSRGHADVLLFRARHAFKKTYSRLAGEPLPAEARVAGLAPLLPALAIPAVLHHAPALPLAAAGGALASAAGAGAAAASAAATASGTAAEASATAAAGVLGKLTTGAAAKAAAVVAAAALIGGGTIVAVEGLPPFFPTAGATAEERPAGTSAADPGADDIVSPSDDSGDHDWAGHHDDTHRSPHGDGTAHHAGTSGHQGDLGGATSGSGDGGHDGSTGDHAGDGSGTTTGSSAPGTGGTTGGHDTTTTGGHDSGSGSTGSGSGGSGTGGDGSHEAEAGSHGSGG